MKLTIDLHIKWPPSYSVHLRNADEPEVVAAIQDAVETAPSPEKAPAHITHMGGSFDPSPFGFVYEIAPEDE